MPRPKEFSEIAALDAAVDRFWQRGYEATSMRDLAVSMGISAPSLYNAFGDKQTFLPALWNGISIAARATDHAGWSLRCLLSRPFIDFCRDNRSLKDRERKGCFLVNSALEVALHQKELGAVIAKQFAEIEAFFKRCIHAAHHGIIGVTHGSMPEPPLMELPEERDDHPHHGGEEHSRLQMAVATPRVDARGPPST